MTLKFQVLEVVQKRYLSDFLAVKKKFEQQANELGVALH